MKITDKFLSELVEMARHYTGDNYEIQLFSDWCHEQADKEPVEIVPLDLLNYSPVDTLRGDEIVKC